MTYDRPTLVEFEQNRQSNNYVPPEESNSFYTIGNGHLNLYCKRFDPALFDAYIESGSIVTGDGIFNISGDRQASNRPYNSMTVYAGASLTITKSLIVNSGLLEVHGTLSIADGASLVVNNKGSVMLYTDSTLVIGDKSRILVERGSAVNIYGDVNVQLSAVESVINNDGIYMDSAAHLNVQGIDISGREFSLTDYEMYLRSISINPYTQGQYNVPDGTLGYTWKAGTPLNGSQCINLSLLWGQCVLGDFKLSILGSQNDIINDLQVVQHLDVMKDTTLFIATQYKGKRYLHPELYVGTVVGNTGEPGSVDIDGNVYVDGADALITLDRGGALRIKDDGILYIQNSGIIRSTYNEGRPVLYIDGTLVIDDINQLVGFSKENIVFGENGKCRILNPDTGSHRVLLSIPGGINESDLFKLFGDVIEHIEYHISANTGIKIDRYYTNYARDMVDWYAGKRFEKAIYDGLIVWHDDGFIELDHSIIPWASTDCTLLHASRLFKSYYAEDYRKLPQVASQLKYAGCGNIVFRFVDGKDYADVKLDLGSIEMTNVSSKPLTDAYTVSATNNGRLFMANMVSNPSEENIINANSKNFRLRKGDNDIKLVKDKV